MSRGKKIIIIANFRYSNAPINYAVWNALKLHVDFIIKAELEPVFYVKDSDSYQIVHERYSDFLIFRYTSTFTLLKSIYYHNKEAEYIWTSDVFSIWKAILPKVFLKKKIISWFQGIIPEESYLRNKSKLRFIILSTLEKLALKCTSKYVFVSEAMVVFFENKYKLKIKTGDYCFVPCFSELKYDPSEKKIKNSFVYIGGLSEWQCFDKILVIFLQIQNSIPNAIFHIITPSIETAQRKVTELFENKKHIKIYQVKDRSSLSIILSRFEYGFLIREDNPINKVASPIKFAEYLSCGVNVIMTDSISHLSKLVRFHNAGIILDKSLRISDICIYKYNMDGALNAYREYFSHEKQQQKYAALLK